MLRKFASCCPASKKDALAKQLGSTDAAPKGKAKPSKKAAKEVTEVEAAEVEAASWFES